MNSQWSTPTPAPVSVPTTSAPVPISPSVTPVVARLNISGAAVYVNLDGQVVSSASYDLKLTPGRYTLMIDPKRLTLVGSGAMYQVGYERNLIATNLIWWSVGKTFVAAPTSSTALDTSLAANAVSVYVAQIIVQGSGTLYVTLDGRAASSSSYDYALTDTGSYGPNDAQLFYVQPSQIKVNGSGGINWKYGYWEYPQGDYSYPLLGRGPYI